MNITARFTPPPSANRIWRNVKGRTLKSAEYREWLRVAAWEIRTDSKYPGPPISVPCHVTLIIPRSRSNADLDNRIKPSLDALQASGILADDKYVNQINATWAAPGTVYASITISDQ